VVANLRKQAAYITDMAGKQGVEKTWKDQVEEQIRTVQTAGNALEDRVR
jgi:hypothetical protein